MAKGDFLACKCGCCKFVVTDSRAINRKYVWRRRKCIKCGAMQTTYEITVDYLKDMRKKYEIKGRLKEIKESKKNVSERWKAINELSVQPSLQAKELFG